MSQSGSYIGSGGGIAVVQTLTGNTGGAVGPNAAGNINVVGNGTSVIVAGNAGTNTLTVNVTGGGLEWNVVAINTAMLGNSGYIANSVGLIQLLLPAVAVVGTIIRVVAVAVGGWQITQNAGQAIRFGNMATTAGVGGSLASSSVGDAVEIVCVTANTGWVVLSGVGNITVT